MSFAADHSPNIQSDCFHRFKTRDHLRVRVSVLLLLLLPSLDCLRALTTIPLDHASLSAAFLAVVILLAVRHRC
uniref:Uncharacterized protein n=1 Tax=Meloidogyne incognita TaxID=6306 RepID=A0A914M4H9_MELIC